MRTGFTVSAIGHAGLILVAALGLGLSRPMDAPPVESIAVDLVPIEEFSNIRMGALDSTVVETETPAVVESEVPAELAQPTGNTEQDQPTPEETPDPSPAPTVEAAPEPVPEPAPVEEPTPEPVPQARPEPAPVPVPEPQPAPEPEPAPELEPTPEPEPEPTVPDPALATPNVSAEPAEVAPRPVTRTASLDEKRAEFRRQQEAARQAREEAERREREEAARIEEARRREDEAARLADDISDIINAEQSRGATTGEGGAPTLGRPDGRSARLTQSETAGLIAQMRACWDLLPAQIEANLSVRLLVSLNPDGSVAGLPQVLQQDNSAIGIATARAAVTAVRNCGPYRLAPEKYESWRQVDVTFRPSEL